ncbi:hypothetical protein U3A55_05105 [Salarchaeum sp. III]|uniref:hypothetical protein n=1 Tax=Salarchaeum sp. III TaxID=3107927 RepID=UPI002ED9B8FD
MHSRTSSTHELPELPTLELGVTLLETESDHATGPLQTLTVDQMLLDSGTALWVAPGRLWVTSSLADLTPSRRIHCGRSCWSDATRWTVPQVKRAG